MGEECSEPFGVSCGLRQGRILLPLLFSLLVQSLVYKLKEAEVWVKCGSQIIPVLLYAEDAVNLAEDERLMRQGWIPWLIGVVSEQWKLMWRSVG